MITMRTIHNIFTMPKSQTIITLLSVLLGFFSFQHHAAAQVRTFDVMPFDKVIISPHIEVIFREGEKESVVIEKTRVSMDKLNVEVKNQTLKIFLDGTEFKTLTKNAINGEYDDYSGTEVRAVITYKNLRSVDLRGAETFVFESPIRSEELKMKIYGESRTFVNNLLVDELKVKLYGESYLEIKDGNVFEQKFTAYGESELNALNVRSEIARITAYGESIFRLNVTESLIVTSFGESVIEYTGDAKVTRGLVVGENTIRKISSL